LHQTDKKIHKNLKETIGSNDTGLNEASQMYLQKFLN